MEQQKDTGRMSDHEVRERVLGGERDLFEIFVRRYSPRLYRVTRSILQSPAEAEDIVQDTFLSAYQHLGQFAGRAQFATWLTRIAIHKALRCASSRSREVPIEDSFDAWMQVNGGEFTRGPEHLASSSERAHILAEAIALLPESYRNVVLLRDFEELKTLTTAHRLGITSTNVKARLHRAHRLLRKRLSGRYSRTRTSEFATWFSRNPV